MNISDDAVRKAAILVAALDSAAADALLENMDEALAARVRASYMDLGQIDESEQRQVIAQFMEGERQKPVEPSPAAKPDALDELSLSSAVPFADYLATVQPTPSPAAPAALPPAADDRAFGFLESATGEQLAAALRREHAQTIAVVLANIAPATAAAALARLSPAQQADVARRIIDLRQVDGEALVELQASLRELLGSRLGEHSSQQTGLEAMQRIWSEAAASDRLAMQRNLRERDARVLCDLTASAATKQTPPAQLAGQDAAQAAGRRRNSSAAPALEFEALLQFDNASLGRVLQRAEGRLLLLALAGASAALTDRVFRQLPRREAQRLRRQIEQQTPIALRDVAEAQRRVAMLAEKLAADGEIELPGGRRFAVAV